MIARLMVLSIVCAPTLARADELAAKLWDEGRALMESGKVDEACDRFERSQQLDPQIGTKLNLAECRAKQRRHAEAFRLFEQAAREAAESGKPGREDYARKRADELAPKIARVKVRVADPIVTVKLGVDGTLVERARAEWGDLAVDPGVLVVEASAVGSETYRTERIARAGDTLEIEVPALAPRKRRITAPKILVGSGGALVLGSLLVGLHVRSRYRSAVEANDQGKVDSAQAEADLATAMGVVGTVAITIGAVIHFSAGPARVSVSPATDGSMGIVFAGRY